MLTICVHSYSNLLCLLPMVLDRVRNYDIILDYHVVMKCFFSPCVMVVSYMHVSHIYIYIYISWRYICILTYSSHAHNEGEPNTNRNINILCILALMFVNAKIIYCIYDTTCMVVINKQKGGD